MAEISINKNDLEDIIKAYKKENNSFVFKSYTGNDDKKICTFIINKKECKIQLFIKKKGTVNILPDGKNREESNMIIQYIASKGFPVDVETKQFTFKCKKENVDALIEYVRNECIGLVRYNQYKDNTHKFTGYNGDVLTLNYYPTTQRAMIQGRPFSAFSIVTTFLSTLPDFSFDEIVNLNNSFINANTSSAIIRDEIKDKLGDKAYKYMSEALIKSISGSLSLLRQNCFCEDYKSCLAGIFVALEGYLKEILINKYEYQMEPKSSFFMFEKDKTTGICRIKNNTIPGDEKDELNKLYSLYSNKRNVYMHSAIDSKQTAIIPKLKDAKNLADEILETIKKSYDIIFK